MKIPSKSHLLALLKKYEFVKQAVADSLEIDEKTVRRWCRYHKVSATFEKKKLILEYKPTVIVPKTEVKVAGNNTGLLKRLERVFVFSDLQIPYQSPQALSIALQRCRDYKPTHVVLIGDFMDYAPLLGKVKCRQINLSTEELQSLELEFIASAKVLQDIEKVLPKDCVKYFIKGNHEDRADQIIHKPGGEYWRKHLDIDVRLNLTGRGWKIVKYNDSVRLGHLWYTHGAYFCQHHAWKHAVTFQKNVMFGHCFDESTEILTKRGWIKGFDLLQTDEVVTMNKESRLLEYNKIDQFYSYDNYNELYEIKGRSTDLLVTDKHGLVSLNENGSLDLFEAQDFDKKSTRKTINAGVLPRNPINLSDDLLRFMVWIAADGSVENYSLVRVHVKKERKVVRFEELLIRLGAKYYKVLYKNGTTRFNVSLNQDIFIPIHSIFLKPLPPLMRNCDSRQANIILEEYSYTDGTRIKSGRYQISSAKENEIDILQELCAISGIRSSKGKNRNCWVLSVNFNHSYNSVNTKYAHFKKVPYSGKVWCVSVDNGTLLVRRNGKVSITQNTHQIQICTLPSPVRELPLYAASVGCLAQVNPEYSRNKPNACDHAWAEVEYLGDDFFPHIHRIIRGKVMVDGKLYKA